DAFGLRDSTLALAIVYASFTLPLAIWLMRAAFRATTVDLEEAAFVDGASRFTAFRRITLPLATPSILVAALVAFLLAYTEFALAWLFISTNENVTLAMILAEATTGFYPSNWSATAAYALLMAIPVVIVLIVLQRALLQGSLAASETDRPRAASSGRSRRRAVPFAHVPKHPPAPSIRRRRPRHDGR